MIDPDEWETLCLLIEEGWPGEFNDATAKAWRVLLDDYNAKAVLVAIKTLVAKGGAFRPSVAELVAAIRRDPSQPTFEEAYALIYGRGGVLSARLPYDGPVLDPDERRDRAARERMAEIHPLVASFVERYGIRRLRMLEVDDPVFGEVRRKELRSAWMAHCDAMNERNVAVSASGGRRGEIGRLDPLAALDRIRGDLAEIAERSGR